MIFSSSSWDMRGGIKVLLWDPGRFHARYLLLPRIKAFKRVQKSTRPSTKHSSKIIFSPGIELGNLDKERLRLNVAVFFNKGFMLGLLKFSLSVYSRSVPCLRTHLANFFIKSWKFPESFPEGFSHPISYPFYWCECNFTLFNAFQIDWRSHRSLKHEDFVSNKWRGLALLGRKPTGSPLSIVSQMDWVTMPYQIRWCLEPKVLGFSLVFPLKKVTNFLSILPFRLLGIPVLRNAGTELLFGIKFFRVGKSGVCDLE